MTPDERKELLGIRRQINRLLGDAPRPRNADKLSGAKHWLRPLVRDIATMSDHEQILSRIQPKKGRRDTWVKLRSFTDMPCTHSNK